MNLFDKASSRLLMSNVGCKSSQYLFDESRMNDVLLMIDKQRDENLQEKLCFHCVSYILMGLRKLLTGGRYFCQRFERSF
jgi:hypothetical protein